MRNRRAERAGKERRNFRTTKLISVSFNMLCILGALGKAIL
jgi:hypothetical protein